MNNLSISVLFSAYGYSRVKLDFWTDVTRNAGGWDKLVSDEGMCIHKKIQETSDCINAKEQITSPNIKSTKNYMLSKKVH